MAAFLWIFWSFSLLGWVLERLFAAVTRSPRRRRRCLLLLPLCPVYGLGMAAVLALPPSLRSGWPLYLWGGLTATSVEYIYHWWGETFLLRSGKRFREPEHLRAWLLRCTVNRCHDLHRFRLRRPVLALADRVPVGVTWWLLLAFTADAVCSLRFLAVTHDLEALRAVIWPVSADR